MRINVYTEELLPAEGSNNNPVVAEVVHASYISSRTGLPMLNYGLRIYLKSSPDLHYIPGRDDDRSAVTFWCGAKEANVFAFLNDINRLAYMTTLDTWRAKVEVVQGEAERLVPEPDSLGG